MSRYTRRQFLYGSTAALTTFSPRSSFLGVKKSRLPKPKNSGIDHIVVAIMENRSFDHLFGWMREADGRQEGLVFRNRNGAAYETYPLAPDFQGCLFHDPDHTWNGGRIAYNEGACDGWLKVGANDQFAIGYYRQEDLPFLGQAARDWTVCSRYFSCVMGPASPNRIYAHAGVTDRLDNSTVASNLPTIWDRLAEARLEGRYYHSDAPFLALWGEKYANITHRYEDFLDDCAKGELPAVAYVDPPALNAGLGTNSNYHPYGDIRAAEYWLYQTYRAVTTSPAWGRTIFVVLFADGGGFFDHVPPIFVNDVKPEFELRGFRVPNLVIAPMARRGHVTPGIYDHTSVLKMIEWRFGLPPLSLRDGGANNLAEVLDFRGRHPVPPPDYFVPPFDSKPCVGLTQIS